MTEKTNYLFCVDCGEKLPEIDGVCSFCNTIHSSAETLLRHNLKVTPPVNHKPNSNLIKSLLLVCCGAALFAIVYFPLASNPSPRLEAVNISPEVETVKQTPEIAPETANVETPGKKIVEKEKVEPKKEISKPKPEKKKAISKKNKSDYPYIHNGTIYEKNGFLYPMPTNGHIPNLGQRP